MYVKRIELNIIKISMEKKEGEKREEEWRKRGLLHGQPPYTDATQASKYKGARASDASLRLCARISRGESHLSVVLKFN